ncbi:hypothetical protein [Nostoc sp. UHCC 0870]|uniref:hypothetical protein n=1 Tax=Nostoc sp. UHCC 0870 TaxID=2914041 RepID=UPI001EDF5DCB|nr:hypothetical protein [Nostoc sp. UHCC 0870]UKP01588.1 hypothetical protein L6494_30770 [Nostoc sp. UHCC 0870]
MDSAARVKKAVEERMKGAKSGSSTTTKTSISNGQKAVTTPSITNFAEDPKAKTTIHGLVGYNSADSSVTVSIPGFERSDLNAIASQVHSPDLAAVTDVKNPGIKNQATLSEFDKAKSEFEGGIRYNELIIWANKYAGSQFKALAEKAKAFGSGLAAQSEIEKVYQQFLELQKQQKITLEKGVDYVAQSHKTATKQAALPYTLAENEATLSKQKSKAEKAYHEALQAQSQTLDFIKSLNGSKVA